MTDKRKDSMHSVVGTEDEREASHRTLAFKDLDCYKLEPIRKPKTKFRLHMLPVIAEQGESSKTNSSSDIQSTNSKKLKLPSDEDVFSTDNIFTSCSSYEAESKIQASAKRRSRYSENIIDYLQRNREFLETYIMENVPVSQLESWLHKKKCQHLEIPPHSGKTGLTSHKSTSKEYFKNLETKLRQEGNVQSIILEFALYLTSSVAVDAYRVFKLDIDDPNSVKVFVLESPNNFVTGIDLVKVEDDKIAFVLDVAKNGISLRLSRESCVGFPKMPESLLKTFGIENATEANNLFYQPISMSGKTIYVIEMWRITDKFTTRDDEISFNIVMSLYYCNMYTIKQIESNMSEFLLNAVKAIFEEMVSLDQLIKSILKSAQTLVNADRASLFLIDSSKSELVSTVFDLKFDHGQNNDMEKTIRMPINRGISGYVALSGETVNILNAYADYRFNREVDEITGYKTISILCMPIRVRGKIIGVVQMVNKLNSNHFDDDDEKAFEKFSTFFGLALHHARLYDKIIRKEQRYKVALEILSYHNTCKEHEVQEVLSEDKVLPSNIDDFRLDPYELDNLQKCKAAIKMFDDLFELSKFDAAVVTRFILTVKKNYRMVPYHNFDHGWSVAHAMYVILKNDHKKRFDYKMKLALFVACLCHDLDHRGYTNKYLNETASPLAAMYTTSPLEHHHFNITVTILQQDGHNIFAHLSSEDYKEILEHIKHCILATDLAAFFPNLAKMKTICGSSSQDKFNWGVPSHRDLAMALSMTAADLSASAKPWKVQIKTVKVIFEEFYGQGDKERAAGKTPIPMMDRNKPEEQPASQVGFLSQICVPCYGMLYKILPQTKPMYKMALENLNNWKSKVNVNPNKIDNDSVNKDISDLAIKQESSIDIIELDSDDSDNCSPNNLND